MASVSVAILGADFLCAHRLLVDMANYRLVEFLCTIGGASQHSGYEGFLPVASGGVSCADSTRVFA